VGLTRHLLQTWKATMHKLKAWERPNLSGSTTFPTKITFFKLRTPSKMLQECSKINLQQLHTKERGSSKDSRKFSR